MASTKRVTTAQIPVATKLSDVAQQVIPSAVGSPDAFETGGKPASAEVHAVISSEPLGWSATSAEQRVPSFVASPEKINLVPEFESLVQQVTELGFDRSVAQRIVLFRGKLGVQGLLARPEENRAVVAYRGINNAVSEYDPTCKDGVFLKSGNLWVSRDIDDAMGFTTAVPEGLLLKFQIPFHFFASDNVRKPVSRASEIPDDRIYLQEVALTTNGKLMWLSYDEAVKRGIVPLITDYDINATISP